MMGTNIGGMSQLLRGWWCNVGRKRMGYGAMGHGIGIIGTNPRTTDADQRWAKRADRKRCKTKHNNFVGH